MVAAESHFDIPSTEEIYLVSQRKYNLDPSRPWWQRWFFRLFLAFNRFAFKHMNIAAPAAYDSQGNIVLIEQQGVYLDVEAARASCRGEFWQVKPLPLNTELPALSLQCGGHEYPRSKIPNRFRRRVFTFAATPVHQMAELKQNLETISKTATGS